jgi:hypothetical protein
MREQAHDAQPSGIGQCFEERFEPHRGAHIKISLYDGKPAAAPQRNPFNYEERLFERVDYSRLRCTMHSAKEGSAGLPASVGACAKQCKGIRMKKIAYAAFASAAALALAACGSSEAPTEATATDSVETMPEETMAADPTATDEAMTAEDGAASDAASDAAM